MNFFPKKKSFLHTLQLRGHSLAAWCITRCLMNFFLKKKRFSHTLHFVITLQLCGRAHDAWWNSFSIKNVSCIHNTSCSLFKCMLHHKMFSEYPSQEKTFLAFYSWISTKCFIAFLDNKLYLVFIANSVHSWAVW